MGWTACVCFTDANRSQGGKRLPEGDHPARRGGGRRTGAGKVRLMVLGKMGPPAGPNSKTIRSWLLDVFLTS